MLVPWAAHTFPVLALVPSSMWALGSCWLEQKAPNIGGGQSTAGSPLELGVKGIWVSPRAGETPVVVVGILV